ncbi:MAG: methyltransferase domain-containing protein [Saprospiraceae bacterium]|nr:methyltransferase domain-containing protein [Saprospiraceae bacterium]
MSRLSHHNPNYQHAEGAFDAAYHLEMVRDLERVQAGKQAIDQTLSKEDTFLELGCGSGIFSIHAARKCKKVYAVDIDAQILEIAKKNAATAGVSHKIEFIHSDVFNLQLPERCDLLFCEMMSIWAINEPQVAVVRYARKHLLKENPVLIPRRILNLVELGQTDYTIDGIEIKASIAQFSGIKAPRIITESRLVSTLNLDQDIPDQMDLKITMTALVTAEINCARLSSIVEFAPGVPFYSTDSLMPLTIVPLEQAMKVEAGQIINFHARYMHRSGLEKGQFWVEAGKIKADLT